MSKGLAVFFIILVSLVAILKSFDLLTAADSIYALLVIIACVLIGKDWE